MSKSGMLWYSICSRIVIVGWFSYQVSTTIIITREGWVYLQFFDKPVFAFGNIHRGDGYGYVAVFFHAIGWRHCPWNHTCRVSGWAMKIHKVYLYGQLLYMWTCACFVMIFTSHQFLQGLIQGPFSTLSFFSRLLCYAGYQHVNLGRTLGATGWIHDTLSARGVDPRVSGCGSRGFWCLPGNITYSDGTKFLALKPRLDWRVGWPCWHQIWDHHQPMTIKWCPLKSWSI